MPAIAKRIGTGSTWRASCVEHDRFRGIAGSMRLAVKQAEDHNRMMHPNTRSQDVQAAAEKIRKEADDARA